MHFRDRIAPHAPLTLCVASIVFFATSLFLTGLRLQGATLSGWHLLAWGWQGLFGFNFAWFANVAYAAALAQMMVSRFWRAFVIMLVAVLLSLNTWLARAWWGQGSNAIPVLGPGAAYYLWSGALLLALVAAFVGYQRDRPVRHAVDPRPLSERWREGDR